MQQIGWRRILAVVVAAGMASLVPRLAQAQTGKITGLVTDATSGQPIEGAQVVVQGTSYGSITQANGRFFILAIPPGTYTVQARRIGYRTQSQTGVVVAIDVSR